MKSSKKVLEVRDLQIEARPFKADPIPIVKGVSFDVVRQKIHNQAEHHRKIIFEEEYVELLK